VEGEEIIGIKVNETSKVVMKALGFLTIKK